jgi:deazaflavin-dependent oxidoreductase (nitroreductase family)
MNRILLKVRRVGGMRELPVLTVAGRRSGKLRSTPLTVVTLDGIRYLLEGFPGADWVRNVRAAGGVAELRTGRGIESVRLLELDHDAAAPVLRAWPVHAPSGAKIMMDTGVVHAITPDAFAALAGRCAVFRVESS